MVDVDAADDQHHGGDHQQQRDQVGQREGVPVDGEETEQRRADERAEREDVAVREVDQLDDAVDHRVAQRDQRVDGAVGDAEVKRLEEGARVDHGLRGEQDDGRGAEEIEAVVGEGHPAEPQRPEPVQGRNAGSHAPVLSLH